MAIKAKPVSPGAKPAVPDWEKFLQASMLLFIGALLGQAVKYLPPSTVVWGILGFLSAYAYSHARHKVATPAGSLLVAAAFFCLCAIMAVRGYTGANHKLQYRICGKPLLDPSSLPDSPMISKFLLGLEIPNHSGAELFAVLDKHQLTLADRSSLREFDKHPAMVAKSGFGVEDAKFDDWIIMTPDLPLDRQMSGQVRYEFLYSLTEEAPKQRLVIDGHFTVAYYPGWNVPKFMFHPSEVGSPGYLPGQCNIEDHSYGYTAER